MISIISISDKLIVGKRVDYLTAYLSEMLFKHNFKINKHMCFSTFSDFSSIFDNDIEGDISIILIDKANVMLNNMLAKKAGCVLVDNAFAKNTVYDFYKRLNCPVEKDCEDIWKIPFGAKAIINPSDVLQGYMMTINGCIYVVLPSYYENARRMFEDVVLDKLLENQKKKYNNFTFKTFGLSENNLRDILALEIKNKDKIGISFFERNLEVDIVIKATQDNLELTNMAQKIFMKLDSYIYAVEDVPLALVAYNLLKLNDLKVAFAEDVTAGNVTKNLCMQSLDAKELISQSIIVSSIQSKIDVANVNPDTINTNGEISAHVAYEMAANLISKTNSNIVVSTLGTLIPTENLPAGVCYIAVGDKKEIHVYKNLFTGSAEEIIENITSASYFYLIKKLKKNDFHFEQSTI